MCPPVASGLAPTGPEAPDAPGAPGKPKHPGSPKALDDPGTPGHPKALDDPGTPDSPAGVRASAPRSAPLVGRTVLLPRLREPDALGEALERAGATVVRAALTRTVTGQAQADRLDALCRDLAAGAAAWLVLTSARTVEALAPRLRQAPSATVRVAVVGPATARAWEKLTGRPPDVVACGSAAALLAQPALAAGPCGPAPPACSQHTAAAAGGPRLRGRAEGPQDRAPAARPQVPSRQAGRHPATGPRAGGEEPPQDSGPAQGSKPPQDHGRPPDDEPPQGSGRPATRRLLLPASALASPALARGLGEAGWEVEQADAYTTVTVTPAELPAGLLDLWRGGGVDAVVLTAPSTTRAVLELLGAPSSSTRVVAIGATTSRAAREAGLEVGGVATSPTPAGVTQAVEGALRAGSWAA